MGTAAAPTLGVAPDAMWPLCHAEKGISNLTIAVPRPKAPFTLIDLNGGELADGDEVKIQYIPGKGTTPDPSKSTFWTETPEGIQRKRQGESFKVKQVGTRHAFLTSKGKFLGQPVEGALILVDKESDAMLVDIIDLTHGVPKAPKAPKVPKAPKPEAPKPEAATPEAPKPETNETAAPAPAEKPAAE